MSDADKLARICEIIEKWLQGSPGEVSFLHAAEAIRAIASSPSAARAETSEDAEAGPWSCARCGSDRWNGWRAGPERDGYPRKAQCVPCGHVQELPQQSAQVYPPEKEGTDS